MNVYISNDFKISGQFSIILLAVLASWIQILFRMEYIQKFVLFVCLLATFVSGISSQVDEEQKIVSEKCLRCICYASTGCNLNAKCDGTVCGPYQISLGYWIDAGSPKVKDNDSDIEDEDLMNNYYDRDDQEYRNCSKNLKCAARAVEAYMQRYAKDCDGDDKINCDDFARIHRLGPFGCSQSLDKRFEKAYKKCIKNNADDL